MATYCLDDGGDREPFSCPICFEDYDLLDARRAPKLLLCLHTFCLECTQKLWKIDGSLECSMCRMKHEQVSLEELFDNHVIIQHLRLEREKADLEFAREIEKELRNNESDSFFEPLNEAVPEPQIDETDDAIEILDEEDEEEEEGEEEEVEEANEIIEVENPSVITVDDSQEEENQRNECQLDLEIIESCSQSDLDNEDDDAEENNVREENGDYDAGVDQPDREGQDDTSDEGSEDNENQVFCFSDFSGIMEQDKEDDIHGDVSDNEDEGDTNEEVYENPSCMVENFAYPFEIDNDDDDDEEDRFHSACDDISTSHWVSDDLQLQEGSEDDADPSLNCWQILRPETYMNE